MTTKINTYGIRFSVKLIIAALIFMASASYSHSQCTVTPSSDWKNTISFPYDPFMGYTGSFGTPTWIKFTILLCDPDTVYFQDSKKYPFHFDFATERLDPFLGLSHDEFNKVTLYTEGQEAILGAVVTPSSSDFQVINECGIQFVGNDPIAPGTIVKYFNLVSSAVNAEQTVKAFYFPTYNQAPGAEQNKEYLESQGVTVSSQDRWADSNTCYSQGWALGRLVYVEGSAINDAYLNGTLGPGDILLTDGVPSEIPFVAGVISLSASTPNSHVAILANTYGIPFVYLRLAEDAARAQELVGHMTAFSAYSSYSYSFSSVNLTDVEGILNEETISEILVLKNPKPLNIRPIATYNGYSSLTDTLVQADIQYFGGKAANFGFLRRTIPDNSPVSTAFSFNLWNEFLDQDLKTGITFREEIKKQLAGITYPPDMAALSETLKGIRDMFKDEDITSFTDAQKQAVISVLQDSRYSFDINKKIRFRSSTNVEDSEQFTGAGLYDSFSGCLADDLDEDDTGPSICDSSKEKERGVFRAIRKVFASFYNDNAFIERLRHNLTENEAGMALLVHHSFPDETELANGVATIKKKKDWNPNIKLVTQAGAVSVTNPDSNAVPEEVNVGYSSYNDTYYPSVIRESSLVLLGGTVMSWEDDYVALSQKLLSVAEAFEETTGKAEYTLDFEYKKIAPDGKLVIKQVREIPLPDTTPTITPFLINKPTEYCVYQGETMEVFALHRLKSRWTLETESFWMTEENLAKGFHTRAELEYMIDDQVFKKSGMMSEWPDSAYEFKDNSAITGWTFSDSLNPRSCKLETRIQKLLVSASENPLLTLRNFGFVFHAEYETSVPSSYGRFIGSEEFTTTDKISLSACRDPRADDVLQERILKGSDGLEVTTSFYWPKPPSGPTAGYTAPLVRWKQTVIKGLTSAPITLTSYFSQTYSPDHHNFSEHFIFDPFLDPNVPHNLLAELRDKDIRMIYHHGSEFIFYKDSSVKGDINHDSKVDMADAILGLQSLTNSNSRVIYLNSDVDGDAKIGLAEVIYSLQSEVRSGK